MKPHLDKLYSIVKDLQNIDVKLDDENLAMYLLCSLPPSYKHFKKTLLFGRDKLSRDAVKNVLTQRDLIYSRLSHKINGGSNSRGLTKIRVATIVSLDATSRKIVRSGRRKIRVMRGLGTKLSMLMIVTSMIVMMVVS